MSRCDCFESSNAVKSGFVDIQWSRLAQNVAYTGVVRLVLLTYFLTACYLFSSYLGLRQINFWLITDCLIVCKPAKHVNQSLKTLEKGP